MDPTCKPLTADQVAREVYRLENLEHPVVPSESFTQESVVFGRVGNRELRGDLFKPKAVPARPAPAVVYIHGGGWSGGSNTQFHRHAAAMTRHGFVGLCVDYRLSGEAGYPAAVEDCKCAVRYLRAHARELHLNPRSIGAVGGSAGAHLAALLATTAGKTQWDGTGGHAGFPAGIQAAVLFNGEFDLIAWWQSGLSTEFTVKFFNKTGDEAPELYCEASPITHVDKQTAPCLLLHGEKDDIVPIQQSVDFHKRILAAGGYAELVRVSDVNHAWFNFDPHYQPCQQLMSEFLLKHLGLV